MSATRFGLEIYRDGSDEPERVTADQRDMAAFERIEKRSSVKALDESPMVLFRFLGYHAQRRTGAISTSVTREDWDAEVIDVNAADDPEPADPGQPEASAATS